MDRGDITGIVCLIFFSLLLLRMSCGQWKSMYCLLSVLCIQFYFKIYHTNKDVMIMFSGGSWSLEPEGREAFSRQAPLGSLG
jgi:hypothetical protein